MLPVVPTLIVLFLFVAVKLSLIFVFPLARFLPNEVKVIAFGVAPENSMLSGKSVGNPKLICSPASFVLLMVNVRFDESISNQESRLRFIAVKRASVKRWSK